MAEEPPAGVRIATIQDEEAIYNLLIELHRHNKFGWGFPYRPEIILRRIEQATRPDPDTRSDPGDKLRGVIGVIDGPDRLPVASVGLYVEPPVWFTDAVSLSELWFYVRPGVRGAPQHERALRDFSLWVHQRLRPKDHPLPFPMATGYMHVGPRSSVMARLWRRLWPGSHEVGRLFWVD